MSDRRHTPRPTLPEGYQYGDASFVNMDAAIAYRQTTPHPDESVFVFERDARLRDCRERYVRPAVEHDPLGAAVLLFGENALKAFNPQAPRLILDDSWRAPHENAAAQLKRQQRTGEETI